MNPNHRLRSSVEQQVRRSHRSRRWRRWFAVLGLRAHERRMKGRENKKKKNMKVGDSL
jgi:hypothetical protein